jgi:hypothetical protein
LTHTRPPWPVATFNAVGRVAALAGGRIRLDEASLVRAARRASGLHTFADESFREPLRVLLDSLERESQLHPLGRMIVRQSLLRALVNRLRMERLFDLHPSIAEQPVQAPVFISGLQRTGTTLLHRLLACEPALRPLMSWEALNAAPFPNTRPRRDGRDPRVGPAETSEKALRYLAPEFFAIHPVEAHAPEEDVLLLDLSFWSPTAEATQRTPSLSRWMEQTDPVPPYRLMRKLIQLLSWQREGRWLGKTPHHLEYLDALFAVFPDARVIQTHRDPLRVVPSFSSMITHGRRIFSDAVDPVEVASHLSRKAVRAVTRSMAFRSEHGDGAFLDVPYAALVADPMKEIRRIYDFLSLALSPQTERSMQAFLARNPQGKHGVHRYRLEDFGMDRDTLAGEFAPYRDRFDIPEEG